MYIPKQTILEESLRREVERICFADTLINRVVYDSVDPSLYTKVNTKDKKNVFLLCIQLLIIIGFRPLKLWNGLASFLYSSELRRYHFGF